MCQNTPDGQRAGRLVPGKGSSIIFEMFKIRIPDEKGGGGLGQIRIRKSLIGIPKYVHTL